MELSAAQGVTTGADDAPTSPRAPESPPPRPHWWRAGHGYPGWVLLDLSVAAVVLGFKFLSLHLRDLPRLEPACWLLAAGVAIQLGQWLWLISPAGRRAPEGVCRIHAQVSGCINLFLAVAVSILAPLGDVPAIIIAVPPLIAVATQHSKRFSVPLAVAIALLSLLPVRTLIKSGEAAQMTAAFNAAGLALGGVIIVLVVSVLTAALRRESARLRASLTELRTTRAKLVAEAKLAAVGRLAAGIAHEIRNPVAMIASSLEMAAQDATPAATRAEMASIARQEAGRLTTLTNDFLAYARGKPPERRDVALADVVGSVASLVKARAAESGVTVRAEPPPGGATAAIDQFQMHQAMLNLATNALDATPAGGTVTIGASAGPLELYVENTGEPVPAEAVDKLFEPFFTTKSHGTGLGLPIARRIVEAHDGELLLARNEPGCVRFAIRLPN
jgi:two-component system, NtrC family, sensor histidine kinase HydH